MKNFFKNILLLTVVLVLSYFTAEYFGAWYDKFSPLYSRSIFALTENELMFLIGFPFSYVFLITILFQLFSSGDKNKWTIWLLVPALLFFGSSDLKHIYLPIILGLIAFGLAKIVSMTISKFKHPIASFPAK